MTGKFYNAATDLLDRNAHGSLADRIYLRTETHHWTYAEVIEQSMVVSAGFLEIGLSKGDRIGLISADRAEYVIAFWAALRAGLVPVLLSPYLAPLEIANVASDASVRLVIFDSLSQAELQQAITINPAANSNPNAVTYVALDQPVPEFAISWCSLTKKTSRPPDPCTSDTDVAFLICSSGTTGRPKLVTHLHGGLKHTPSGLGQQVVHLCADDIVLSVSKLSFSYGLANSIYMPAVTGASTILLNTPSLPAIIESQLKKNNATVLYGVPSFFRACLATENFALPATIRRVLSAGEHLPVSISTTFEKRYRHTILNGYGTTETLQHVFCNAAGRAVEGSCGELLNGFRIEIRDSQGITLDGEQVGELWISGQTLYAGYWQQDESTSNRTPLDWLRTGDAVRMVNGYLYHYGRLDDLVKIDGRWACPAAIEEVMIQHPDLHDIAIVSDTSEVGLSYLLAFVVSSRADDRLFGELADLCRQSLSSHQIPRQWVYRDSLPRTATGKLRRQTLRQSLHSGQSGDHLL